MKIRVEPKAFQNAVTWAAKGIAARPPQQEMTNLVIQTIGDTPFIGIATTDSESVSKACIASEVLTTGAISVPGKLLADIAGRLRNETVEITVEKGKAVLTCGPARYNLPMGDLSKHPQAPKPDGPSFGALPKEHGKVAASEFASAVAQVAQAAGKDPSLPVLTGVQVTATSDKLILAATDRYRIAVREIAWSPADATAELPAVLVPAAKLVDANAGLAQAQTETIALSLPSEDDPQVTLAGRGRVAVTRTLGGEFPKWASILTKCETDAKAQVTLQVKEFIAALNEVRVVGKKTDAVRLTFSENTCLMEAAVDSVEGSSSAECSYEGEELTIAFNAEFLVAGLEAAGTPSVTLALSGPNAPALLRAATPGFRYMLMPVRINTAS